MTTGKELKTILLLILAAVALSAPSLDAQTDTNRVVYYVGKNIRGHPDGAIGAISFHGQLTYGAVNKGVTSGPDIQKYDFGLLWVAGSRVTMGGRFLVVDEDSLRYELNGGLTVYTRDPTQPNRSKNPDGAIGGLAISLTGGMRYPDLAMETSKFVGDVAIALPVSRRISLTAGYRYYEDIELFDTQQGFGGLNLYLTNYSADAAYNNPDGPVGVLALSLTGGGSSEGFFGQLSLLFPISANLTWKLLIRGERTKDPYRRVPIGGAGVSFYPGN